MYTQIFFVTSVRGMVLPPQIAANAGLNVFGAKIPTPFFFMSAAFFLPVADCAFLPAFFFSAFSVAFVAFVMVVFVVFGATVVVVIAIEEWMEGRSWLRGLLRGLLRGVLRRLL